jgi:hypothetical protein
LFHHLAWRTVTMLKLCQTWLLARQFCPCIEWNLWQQYAARAKFKSLCTVGRNLGQNCHRWMSVTVQTFHWYPTVTCDNNQILAHQVLWLTNWLKFYSINIVNQGTNGMWPYLNIVMITIYGCLLICFTFLEV